LRASTISALLISWFAAADVFARGLSRATIKLEVKQGKNFGIRSPRETNETIVLEWIALA
jgi:hypothetical protein